MIEREAPGHRRGDARGLARRTPATGCSRAAVAGIRGATLIVNFPGSPTSIEQAGEAIAGALPHALALIAGRSTAH